MTDYDSPWKTVLERFFPAFMGFYFPTAHAGIDWTQGYTFLDKELQKVVRAAKLGRRWADSQFEEEKRMRYVSSFERIAAQRGMERRMEKGMEKGISRGQALLLRRQLIRRFGPLPKWAEAQLNQADSTRLELWTLRVLEAGSLEEMFGASGGH